MLYVSVKCCTFTGTTCLLMNSYCIYFILNLIDNVGFATNWSKYRIRKKYVDIDSPLGLSGLEYKNS